MNFGSHMSISGGVHKAIERGASLNLDCLQIFTKSSNQWKAKPYSKEEISMFSQLLTKSRINPVVAHASYLINLASPEDALWEKSRDSFIEELLRCDQLNIPYIVIHPGSHKGSGEKEGILRIARALNQLYSGENAPRARVLLETTSGQGSNLGYNFEQLAAMIEKSGYPDKVGICLDTCHIFSAGYDIRTSRAYAETFKQFDSIIGLEKLKAIHLNDSKKELSSRIDRHEHIGKGFIGLSGFRNLVNDDRLDKTPMILETPKDEEMKLDRMNLEIINSLINK
jgi:deoxyribonuclease IV